MKKGLLIASIASVTAVSAGLAFAVAHANKGIRFEAAKADPVTATVTYDKDNHASNPTDYGGITARYDYNAESTSGGYVYTWLQLSDTSADKWDAAPADAYFTYTSKGSGSFFLRMTAAGASNVSFNITYTGLDEDHQGHVQLNSKTSGWGFDEVIHSSGLWNNGEKSIDITVKEKVSYLELYLDNIPENAVIKIEEVSISYSVSACEAEAALL